MSDDFKSLTQVYEERLITEAKGKPLYTDVAKQAELVAKEINKLEKLLDKEDKNAMNDIMKDATNAINLRKIDPRDFLFTAKMVAIETSSFIKRAFG